MCKTNLREKLAVIVLLLLVTSGQTCPMDGEIVIPVADLIPGPEGAEGPPGPQGPQGPEGPPGDEATLIAGDGILIESGVVSLDHSAIESDYWRLGGNSGSAAGIDVLGTLDDQPLEIHVNGTRVLRLEPTDDAPNLIGGDSENSITNGIIGATVVGGGVSPDTGNGNYVSGDFGSVVGGTDNNAGRLAFIGGGAENRASANVAVVCGGFNNRATNVGSFAGGGFSNEATDLYSTAMGGFSNDATGRYSTVGGGENNEASGSHSTVSGGASNVAAGDYSFAVGSRAKANHRGAFVWGDRASTTDVSSFGDNTFTARAAGGVRFYSSLGTSLGVELPAGDSAWTSLSDRNAKENIIEVDSRDVLRRVASMSIATWNYKAQDKSIRHIGPMAQDFYEAFGLGHCDTRISTIDADGVALAAIRGLNEIVREQESIITSQEHRIKELEKRLERMEGLLP